MNRIMLSTAAALAVAIVPSVYADGHRGGGGGDRGGGSVQFNSGAGRANGGASISSGNRFSGGSAPVRVQQAPQPAFQAQARSPREPQTRVERQVVAQENARSVQQRINRQAPSIAFGGSVPRNVDRDVRIQRDDSRTFNRSDFRGSRPTGDISRHWDRQRIHVWNNHRYHWYNNAWVLFDGGYGYGDPYFYDNTPGYTYYQDSPVYDDQPVEYAATGGMATAVQQALARRGYDPGPIDGAIGPQSRDAIIAFQSDRGLPVTGLIDRALLRALDL